MSDFSIRFEEYEDDVHSILFELSKPIHFGVLINYLGLIIKQLWNGKTREASEKIIEDIKKSPNQNNEIYHYNDITIGRLFNADYEFLKKHFIINWEVIKNEKDFNNNL